MLENLIGKSKRSYAIETLRRLEGMRFDTKELAEKYFNITYDVLREDLEGINVEAHYSQTMLVTVEGPEIGKRDMVWYPVITMEKIIVQKF